MSRLSICCTSLCLRLLLVMWRIDLFSNRYWDGSGRAMRSVYYEVVKGTVGTVGTVCSDLRIDEFVFYLVVFKLGD